MFDVGDLVTVDSDALRLHVRENTYEQWETNKLGIVVAVEGYKGGATVLVKVHFESLGNSYWLYSREVILITP